MRPAKASSPYVTTIPRAALTAVPRTYDVCADGSAPMSAVVSVSTNAIVLSIDAVSSVCSSGRRPADTYSSDDMSARWCPNVYLVTARMGHDRTPINAVDDEAVDEAVAAAEAKEGLLFVKSASASRRCCGDRPLSSSFAMRESATPARKPLRPPLAAPLGGAGPMRALAVLAKVLAPTPIPLPFPPPLPWGEAAEGPCCDCGVVVGATLTPPLGPRTSLSAGDTSIAARGPNLVASTAIICPLVSPQNSTLAPPASGAIAPMGHSALNVRCNDSPFVASNISTTPRVVLHTNEAVPA